MNALDQAFIKAFAKDRSKVVRRAPAAPPATVAEAPDDNGNGTLGMRDIGKCGQKLRFDHAVPEETIPLPHMVVPNVEHHETYEVEDIEASSDTSVLVDDRLTPLDELMKARHAATEEPVEVPAPAEQDVPTPDKETTESVETAINVPQESVDATPAKVEPLGADTEVESVAAEARQAAERIELTISMMDDPNDAALPESLGWQNEQVGLAWVDPDMPSADGGCVQMDLPTAVREALVASWIKDAAGLERRMVQPWPVEVDPEADPADPSEDEQESYPLNQVPTESVGAGEQGEGAGSKADLGIPVATMVDAAGLPAREPASADGVRDASDGAHDASENPPELASHPAGDVAAEEAPQDPAGATFAAAWEVDSFQWPEICTELDGASKGKLRRSGEELYLATQDGLKVLAVSSSARHEGRTTMALALARVAAGAGCRVALLDADVANPELARRLGLESPCSWTEVAGEHKPLTEAAVASVADGITLFPLTSPNDNLQATPDGRVLADVLQELSEHFDLIVVDTHPAAAGDVEIFDRGTPCPIDMAVVVRHMRATSQEETLQAVTRLRSMGVKAVGLVENFGPPSQSATVDRA